MQTKGKVVWVPGGNLTTCGIKVYSEVEARVFPGDLLVVGEGGLTRFLKNNEELAVIFDDSGKITSITVAGA